jgi:hypothetical protein
MMALRGDDLAAADEGSALLNCLPRCAERER